MGGCMGGWMVLNPFKELPTAIINQIFRATNLQLRKIKECLKGGRLKFLIGCQIAKDCRPSISIELLQYSKLLNMCYFNYVTIDIFDVFYLFPRLLCHKLQEKLQVQATTGPRQQWM